MIRDTLRVLVLAATFIAAPTAVFSAEELFDTGAALEHIDKGIAHLQQKNYRAAIKEFEEASLINPDAEAFYYLGYAYYMDGKTTNNEGSRKLSMENFQKAYEIDPNYTPTKFMPEEEPTVKKTKPPAPEQVAPPASPEQQPAETTEAEPQQPSQ